MSSLVVNSFEILTNAKVVFWDFDGVIKDSADIKVQAYVDMFADHGTEIQSKVLSRYKVEGGMSRFKLIPLFYRDIVGMSLTDEQLNTKLNLYSEMVVDRVIQSPYISGIQDYLKYNFERQNFIIVTNTPKSEIDLILNSLGINKYFAAVFGAPDIKEDIVRRFLDESDANVKDCVLVGDSQGDLIAARTNGIPFIFRGIDNSDRYEYSLLDFSGLNG